MQATVDSINQDEGRRVKFDHRKNRIAGRPLPHIMVQATFSGREVGDDRYWLVDLLRDAL